MIRKFILLLLFAWSASSYAQKHLALDLLDKKQKQQISYKYKNGFIIVEVLFQNYIPFNFIVDTGAEHTILFKKEITDLLKVPYERQISVLGSDLSAKMYAQIVRNISLKVDDCPSVSRDIVVLEKDYLHMSEINGIDVDGILGGEFFRGLVVEFDYDDSKIRLYHPDKYTPASKYSVHDIEINQFKPYINASYLSSNVEIQDTTKLSLLLDTGAAITFMLFTNADSTVVLPPHAIPGNLGKGLGGDVLGYVGKSNHIGLDKYAFDRVITYFQEVDSTIVDVNSLQRQGLIGNLVLSRFDKMVIDYTYQKLYLQPSKKYNKKFEYDKSGLNIYAVGPKLKTFFVQSVLKDSPAHKAGILPGDMITKIGWWSTRWYSLQGISGKLSGKEGKKIKMQLKRHGYKYKTEFILQDLFDSQ